MAAFLQGSTGKDDCIFRDLIEFSHGSFLQIFREKAAEVFDHGIDLRSVSAGRIRPAGDDPSGSGCCGGFDPAERILADNTFRRIKSQPGCRAEVDIGSGLDRESPVIVNDPVLGKPTVQPEGLYIKFDIGDLGRGGDGEGNACSLQRIERILGSLQKDRSFRVAPAKITVSPFFFIGDGDIKLLFRTEAVEVLQNVHIPAPEDPAAVFFHCHFPMEVAAEDRCPAFLLQIIVFEKSAVEIKNHAFVHIDNYNALPIN